MKHLVYYAAGSLHNRYIGVDGGSLIRLPFMRQLQRNDWVVHWVGNSKGVTRRTSPLLNALSLTEEKCAPYVIDMNAQVSTVVRYERWWFQNVEALVKDAAAIFIELRPFESKPGYNFAEEASEQAFLMEQGIANHKIVFVHDQDGWYQQIPKQYRKHIVLLRAYDLNGDGDYSDFAESHYFLWAWDPEHSFMMHTLGKPKVQVNRLFDTVYCGNVYGRREEFAEFFKPLHDAGQSIAIAGNWLRTKYGDRDFILDALPNAVHLGQTEHWSTIPLLASGSYAVHVANPDQQRLGVIGIRVFEAFMAGVPLFANSKIKDIEHYVTKIQMVSSGEEILEMLRGENSRRNLRQLFYLWYQQMFNKNIYTHTTRFDEIYKGVA